MYLFVVGERHSPKVREDGIPLRYLPYSPAYPGQRDVPKHRRSRGKLKHRRSSSSASSSGSDRHRSLDSWELLDTVKRLPLSMEDGPSPTPQPSADQPGPSGSFSQPDPVDRPSDTGPSQGSMPSPTQPAQDRRRERSLHDCQSRSKEDVALYGTDTLI